MAGDCLADTAAADLKGMLLARLRRVLPAKSLQFSEIPGTASVRAPQPVRTRDYVAYTIPSGDAARRMLLEASFASEGAVDEWNVQVMQSAANLATIIFEVERLTRLADATATRPVDGAAPLIGSSVAMQALRERIERVATTDFTVLIEGLIEPQ
jgi:transcriptional regulator with PAS, ATPase and Fis domain